MRGGNEGSDDEIGERKKIAKHEIDEDDRRRIFFEQKKAAQANRDRMKNVEMGGGNVKDALVRDNDDEPKPEKKKVMNMDEINAYMREQRHIARANKARAQAAEGESPFGQDLRQNAQNDDPKPQKKREMDLDDINAYMREQRHIARDNKARAQAAENESAFERKLKENAQNDDEKPQKKREMGLDEINAYMREQRHIARDNKARAQAAEHESAFEQEMR
jgi:NIMA (never in mitosis gene a)-related kinase